MNEKIKQLALDAGIGFTLWDDSGREMIDNYTPEEYLEKFAELIVERCMALCDGNHEYKNHTDTEFGKGVATGIQLSKNMINVHFGVEL
jgi:hypothetical protein